MNGSQYLTTQEAAGLLNQDNPLAVSRLIARGALPAGRLGEAGAWRVKTSDIDGFISKNCPDLQPPDFQNRSVDAAARRFVDALYVAMESQRLDQAEAAKLAIAARGEAVVVDLAVSPEIRAVLDAPPAKAFGGITLPGPPKLPFQTWGELFLVSELRKVALGLCEKIGRWPGRLSGLGRLYESPERYREIVDEAVKLLLSQKFTSTQYVTVSIRGLAPKPSSINYVLPFSKITAPDASTKLPALAF